VSFVGKCVAASVPQHMWVSLKGESGFGTRALNHSLKSRYRERCAALRSEHERGGRALFALQPPKTDGSRVRVIGGIVCTAIAAMDKYPVHLVGLRPQKNDTAFAAGEINRVAGRFQDRGALMECPTLGAETSLSARFSRSGIRRLKVEPGTFVYCQMTYFRAASFEVSSSRPCLGRRVGSLLGLYLNYANSSSLLPTC
jgi:hypothetical protein